MTSSRTARPILAFFLFVLIVDSIIGGVNIYRSWRNEAWVSHTLQVLRALSRLREAVTDAERSVRGFIITDDEGFLPAYNRVDQLCADILRETKELMPDNPAQLARLGELEPLLQNRLKLFHTQVETRRAHGDAAQDKALVIAGRDSMRQFMSLYQAIVDDEDKLLAQRGQAAQSTLLTSITTTAIGSALIIGMLALSNGLIRREFAARRRSEEAHAQNEDRFRAIAESLPQIVWVTRADGAHQYFNKRWYNFTGLSPAQSLGFAWIHAVHPEDHEIVSAAWRQACTVAQPFEIEFRLRHQTGAFRWHLGRAVPLTDKLGRVSRWFGTSTDIDDRKRLRDDLEDRVRERTAELRQAVGELNHQVMERERSAEQLRQSATELARSNRELEQFAYVASHDLQEPLRKIQAFGDRLNTKSADLLDEQSKTYLTRMMSSARRMSGLIDDLLTYSRVSTRPRSFVAVDLNQVAADVLSDLEEMIEQTQAKVDAAPLPTIGADPTQMRQLFQNLLVNAIKFHKPDTPPRVTVRTEDTPSDGNNGRPMVRIVIADNGIGFDAEYQNRIFQLFQRLHSRDEYEGTGIGLAVVRKIVERHGGTVCASSSPGAGATFIITLPVNLTQSTEDAAVMVGV